MNLLTEGADCFIACFAFGIVFQLRQKRLWIAAIGGILSWISYQLFSNYLINDIVCYFLATLVLSVYAECMARWQHAPCSIFLVLALLPLVPGGGIYDTMELCVQGQTAVALKSGMHTVAIAGALALGIVMVSSVFRIFTNKLRINP